jgi:hypothetical protein
MAVIGYKVLITNPGRYYVWVRAFSTGSEDNGLHVGIDGTWPASGQRLQWCEGKRTWRWESKQRTEREHCGEPHKIYLDIEQGGQHTIAFSMREDGFEFDKWLMTKDRELARPDDVGPKSLLHAGSAPKSFPFIAAQPQPSTDRSARRQLNSQNSLRLPATSFSLSGTGFYLDRGKWAAINPDQRKNASAGMAFEPADDKTRRDAKPFIAKQAVRTPTGNVDQRPRDDSPTTPVSKLPLVLPRGEDGTGDVEISGELKVWHKATLTLDGPYAHEQDNEPNPFTDHRMTVRFKHTDGTTYSIPGYFAADGNAANSSAHSGTKWRAHFAPDREGDWNYMVHFSTGKHAALDSDAESKTHARFDSKRGEFSVTGSDKTGRDLRALGRLQYVGKRYLQHAGNKQFFLKAGADAPETLLAFADFDNTVAGNPDKAPLKTWAPHLKDWNDGDPSWKDGKGKGLIGAVNYLSSKGCNAFSFLTYNAGGDGDNVWPFIDRDDKLHYDCSKLDQWSIVFDHGTAKGMYLHFKMQETEMDDHIRGKGPGYVSTSLDGGNLGAQRKLYCRELIARFAHNLALNWNLGEENTQTTAQQTAMINYIADLDAYHNHIVIHTFPNQQEKVYRPLLGPQSKLTGVSLQNSGIKDTHVQTVKWVRESANAGKPWVVAFDESGTAAHGQCPDLGYQGFDGRDRTGKMIYDEHAVRRQTLWGTLMGGGAGVEYYFGYQFVENDLVCQDWRSRDRSWDYCRIALEFFRENQIPIETTSPADELVGNTKHDNSSYCLAKPGQLYLVYLPDGGQTELDLSDASGMFEQSWLNPRTGEVSAAGAVGGGKRVVISTPGDQEEDVLVILQRRE